MIVTELYGIVSMEVSSNPSNELKFSVKRNLVMTPYLGVRAFSNTHILKVSPNTTNTKPVPLLELPCYYLAT